MTAPDAASEGRSARARRTLTTWLTLLGLGCLILWLATEPRSLLVPGGLSRAHGPLGERCEECHAVAEAGLAGWALAAVEPGRGEGNDALCLTCHELGPHPQAAHGFRPEEAAAATARAQQAFAARGETRPFQAAVVALTRPADGYWPCAACHREHRGADADITALSEARCQSCHLLRFRAFAVDHPDLLSAGGVRGTLRYGHTEHRVRHFPEAGREHRCSDCHVARDGELELVDFEQGCASCHLGQIQGEGLSGARGVTVLRVPGLDLEALAARGARIPDWPEDAEEAPSPLMNLLLADGAYTRALDGIDLLDLGDASDPEIARVAAFANDVDDLFRELEERGQEAFRDRLQRALGRELSHRELAAVVAGLGEATVRTARRRWQGDADLAATGGDAWVAAGGWFIAEYDHAIAYRPSGHADPLLGAWLELAADPRASSDGARAALDAILEALAAPQAPGACGKCHVIDKRQAIRWRHVERAPRRRTRFAHRPHLGRAPEASCAGCHHQQGSDFAAIRRSDCGGCHVASAAGDDCLQCHSYHQAARP